MAATVALVVLVAEELDFTVLARASAATVAMGAMAVEVAARMTWLCVARLAALEAVAELTHAMEWKALLATTPILLARISVVLVAEAIELMAERAICTQYLLRRRWAAAVAAAGMVARVVTVLYTTARVTVVAAADMERLNWLAMERLGSPQRVQQVD